MNGPLVSIILPVYNVEKYLDKCLISILEQSFDDFELIIVNDGSSDNCANIIDIYQKRCPSIIKIIVQENKGLSAARNTGMNIATGKYLLFIDSDDYIGKDFLLSIVGVAEQNDSDMTYVKGHTKVDESGGVLCETIYNEDRFLFRVRSAWGHMYKRELIDKYSLTFPIGCNYEDNYFNLFVEKFTDRCFPADNIDYFYVQRDSSLRFTAWKKVDDSRFPYEQFRSLFADKTVDNTTKSKFEFSVIRFFTAVIFSNGRKSNVDVIQRLCTFFSESLILYFPNYYCNEHLNPFRYKQVPFSERLGIWFFVKLVKFKLLKPFAILYTRF